MCVIAAMQVCEVLISSNSLILSCLPVGAKVPMLPEWALLYQIGFPCVGVGMGGHLCACVCVCVFVYVCVLCLKCACFLSLQESP